MSTERNMRIVRALDALRDDDIVHEARAYADVLSARHRRRKRLAARVRSSAPILALALLLVGGFGAVVVREIDRDAYSTAVGKIRRVELADGSVVTLNTDTRIVVRMSAHDRAIMLDRGEAHFEVAKDPARPFVVSANGLDVVATGTAFDVAKSPSQTVVTLIEGSVDVSLTSASGEQKEKLTAGEQLAFAVNGAALARRPVARDVLAWQRGKIEIDNLPLSEALADINRYSKVQIGLSDPKMGDIRISGVFAAGDTPAIVTTLEQYLDAEISRPSRNLVVLRPR